VPGQNPSKCDGRVALEALKVRQSEIGARIEVVRGSASQADFASEMGVSTQTLGRYERGDRPPDLDFLVAMREKRGISADWLISGQGRRHLAGSAVSAGQDAFDASGFVEVPLYKNVAARAGGGALVDPEAEEYVEMRAFSGAWIRRELRASPADLALMHVEGDSMDDGKNGLKPGDVMMVNKADTSATKDGVYVLVLDGALLVKRLQRLPGDRLRVMSDNNHYPAFEVDLKDARAAIKIIGRVVYAWGGRRF
jgi:phage repressor protein C with HTH and peptisase S24 domain